MRTFVQKPQTVQQTKAPNSVRPGRAFASQNREPDATLHSRSTSGNPAVRRLLQPNGQEREDSALSSSAAFPHFVHNFSLIPLDTQTHINMQPKLGVNGSSDRYEQEADSVAERVVHMLEPQARGTFPCAGGGSGQQMASTGNEPNLVQARRTEASELGPSAAMPAINRSPDWRGQPLDIAARSFFEPRFGWNFSNVRVHTDRKAAESAAEINARAYTVGQHLVFSAGEYAPSTNTGRNLIAHELVHVVQQHTGAPRQIARKPVTRYGTDAVKYTRADIEDAIKGVNYWEQLVFGNYDTTYVSPVTDRFKKDTEERDAVLAAMWQSKPEKVKGKVTRSVAIPARGAKTKPLLYKFTFQEKGKDEKLDKLLVEFQSEGIKADIINAPTPATGYKPSSLSVGSSGFPESIHDYWKKHPDEHSQVYHWVEKLAGDTFDQKLITKTKHEKKERNVLFRVEGTKQNNKVTKLEVTFLADQAPQSVTPAPGYDQKDAIDLELEKAQARKDNRLGTITGLNSVPADERTSVKYTIWQYVDSKAQNTEVDVIVPIANKPKRVFYTLRFQQKDKKSKKIDVEVARVGEEKKGTTLDTDQFSIRRVHGFAANLADVPTLTAWLKTRYPSITPRGTTVDEVVAGADKDMQSNAKSTNWFKDNYDIHILSAADGATRLQTIHKFDLLQTANMKAFKASELSLLEFSLQTMSEPLLAQVKTVRMTRQNVKQDKKKGVIVPDTKTGGLTLTVGSEKTIIIFDAGIDTSDLTFIGGTQGVRQPSTQLFTHELGHVVEGQNKIKAKFNDFVKKNKIKPITDYAASNKQKEFFPEAFSLYQNDPVWMKTNLPDLFQWFETLSQTGKAP